MKISYGALIPLPPDEAFGFVADPVNWPLFFPGVRSVDKGDDWGRVGGHARLTSVVLGRSLTMDLELTEWDPPRSFRYTVSQGGNPGNDDNRRTFQPLPDGTRLVGTTEIPTRAGPTGSWIDCKCSSSAECSPRQWPDCQPQPLSIIGAGKIPSWRRPARSQPNYSAAATGPTNTDDDPPGTAASSRPVRPTAEHRRRAWRPDGFVGKQRVYHARRR
jgi:hypothetical protein